jgi:hypothetical protein
LQLPGLLRTWQLPPSVLIRLVARWTIHLLTIDPRLQERDAVGVDEWFAVAWTNGLPLISPQSNASTERP